MTEQIAEIKRLLTEGFFVSDLDFAPAERAEKEHALRVTKEWRGQMWKKLCELEKEIKI